MQIGYSKRFKKQLKKSPRQIKCAFRERLHLFIQNKHHRLLDNHELTGKWQPYKSINITGDWRAVNRNMMMVQLYFSRILGNIANYTSKLYGKSPNYGAFL